MKRYAIFNSADIGTGLEVQQGGAVVTTTAGALNVNRMVRGTLGVTGDSHYAEFIVYGTHSDPLTNLVSIGVATSLASLSTYVGGDDNSIGYRLAEGEIHRNGSSVASVASGGIGSVVGVLVTFGDGVVDVAFYLDGAFLYAAQIIDDSTGDPMFDQPIYFAVSLGSTAGGDILTELNAGLDDFEFPNPITDGWWSAPLIPAACYFSDYGFITAPTDVPANVRYTGNISATGFRRSAALSFWPWGDSDETSGSAVSIEITDPDHEFSRLLSGGFRDLPCEVVVTETTLDEGEPLASLVFERCEVIDDMTKRVWLRDQWAILESTRIQRRNFRPDAELGAENRPWPVTVGAAFSVPLVPFADAPQWYMAIDSVGAEGIGTVRDRGVPVDPIGSPMGYTLEAGGQYISMTYEPAGQITADVAVTGTTYIPPAPVDGIDGEGDPFAGTPGGPFDDWTAVQTDISSNDNVPRVGSVGDAVFPQNAGARSYIENDNHQLQAGQRYRVSFTIQAMEEQSMLGSPCTILIGYQGDGFGNYFSVNSNVFYSGNPFGAPRSYASVFTPVITHYPFVIYVGNNTNGGTSCRISDLQFIELPPLTGDEEALEEQIAALALGLPDLMDVIIEQRGRRDASTWSRADAQDIQDATGYTQGYHANEGANLREAIKECLTGYTVSAFLDRAGVIRFARLIAPEGVPESSRFGELRETRMLSTLTPRRDDAPGLTRSMGARRNELPLTDADLDTENPLLSFATRRRLARSHRYVVTSGAQLAAGYQQAEAADYVGTRVVMPYHAQAEIDRVCALYTVDRSFYGVEIEYMDGLELGHVLDVFYSFYGLEEGMPLLVVGIDEDPIARTMNLTLWGEGPEVV